MPSHNVKSAVDDHHVVRNVLQTILRRDMIVELFKITGQDDPFEGGCNFDRIQDSGRHFLQSGRWQELRTFFPSYAFNVAQWRAERKGLQKLDFDDTTSGTEKPVLNHRRLVFLTNLQVIASGGKIDLIFLVLYQSRLRKLHREKIKLQLEQQRKQTNGRLNS